MKKVFLILICCTVLLYGCGDSKKNAYYDDALKSMEAGDYEEAVSLLQDSIEAKTRLPESYRAQGISYMKLGDYASAVASFSRSINSMEGSNQKFKKDVMYYLAEAREAYGQIDEAIEVYTDILKMDNDVQSFFLRGKLYLEKEDYDSATEDFSKSLEKSRDYDLYINIFNEYEEHNMTIEGSEYLEQALEMEPQQAGDYYQRGRIYYHMKDYNSAQEELTKAIKEGDRDAVLLLGKVYIALEDSGSARAMYQEYLSDQEEQAKAYNGLALCDIYDKNYDSALANIEKGLECQDEEEKQSLLFNEIIAYEYKLDFETAKQKMSAYLELYPEDEAASRENEFLQSR